MKIGAFAVIIHYFCSKQSFELICSIQNFPLAFHFQERYTNAEGQNGKENLQMLDESTNLLLKMLNLELEALHTSYEHDKPVMPVRVFTSPTQQKQRAAQMANQHFNRFNINAFQHQKQYQTNSPNFQSPGAAAAAAAEHRAGDQIPPSADTFSDVKHNHYYKRNKDNLHARIGSNKPYTW